MSLRRTRALRTPRSALPLYSSRPESMGTLATCAGNAALDHRREHVGNRHRLRAVLDAAWEWALQRDTAPWLSPMARAPTSHGLSKRKFIPAKTRHQEVASETRGRNGASVIQFPTRRPRGICEMPRYRVVLRAFAGWPVETGLAGWGGRIRTSAFRIGSGGPSRLGPTPNSFIQADETRTPPFGKSSKELQKRLAFYVEQSVSVAGR